MNKEAENIVLNIIKENNWDENSPEMFMFSNNPILFISYISFLRKDILPKVGDKVLTLRGGFGSFESRILYVSEITDKYIELADFIIDESEIVDEDEYYELCNECEYYLSEIEKWYTELFRSDDNN